MTKRIIIALITGLFLNFTVSATMISFYIIETGLNEEAKIGQSELWEGAFMDVFFDAGYIVSNAPVLRLDKKPPNMERLIDLEEAEMCGVNFVLVAQLDYADGFMMPGEISVSIYNVMKKEKLMERKMAGKQYNTLTAQYDNMKSIARAFVPYIE
ncbi:MAG: hypothetical protein FWB86_08470 [Treponema sp.]|nr:hypothetical protein [Treponema sp.]